MRLICLLIMLCLLFSPAAAEEATVTDLSPAQYSMEDAGLTLLGHRVSYPRITGMEDAALEALINQRIAEAAGAAEWTARLSEVLPLEDKLTCSWTAEVFGELLCCVFFREGPLRTARHEEEASSLLISLSTGEVFHLANLYADREQGLSALTDTLWEVSGSLSPMLPVADLLPAPEAFALTQGGVVLYYPSERFQTLSGHAGRLRLSFAELGVPLLDLSESGPLKRAGLLPAPEEAAAMIAETVSRGALPGVPAELGQSVSELTDTYGLAIDPDFYEDGRYVTLEDGLFHGVTLMTDRLYEKDLSSSLLSGLRADSFSLCDLHTGLTEAEEWRALLGEPSATVAVDDAMAEGLRIVPGVSDYYHFGGHTLRLHADEAGVLRTIIIK